MAQIDVRRLYADGDILLGADLDAFLDDIEAFLNTTKINNDNIQNNSITASDKLADASISAAKIQSDAVTTAKILDANVTTAKIADDAVTAAKIADGAIDAAAKLASDVVETAKIKDANVTKAKLSSTLQTQLTALSNLAYTSQASVATTVTVHHGVGVATDTVIAGASNTARLLSMYITSAGSINSLTLSSLYTSIPDQTLVRNTLYTFHVPAGKTVSVVVDSASIHDINYIIEYTSYTANTGV